VNGRAAHLLATIDDNKGALVAVNTGSKWPKAPHSRAVRAEGDDKGYARNAHVHHGRREVGVDLITKPFSYADLAAKVRDVLDGA
jgi:hypothetical protein